MIGLTQEPFDTNDDGRRDRVKFRDAIASKSLFILIIQLPLKTWSKDITYTEETQR